MSSNSLPSYEDLVQQNSNSNNNSSNNIYSGYEAPPLDETNTNFKNYTDNVNPPDHEILVFEKQYLSKRHNIFCIREGFSSFTSHVILVLDSENKEVFNCKDKGERIVLYDIDKTPILNAYAEVSDYKNIRIFGGKKDNIYIGAVKTNDGMEDSIRTFTADFINKITRDEEEFEIRYNKINNFYAVYCNPGKPNEVMIGKITKASNLSKKIMVEVAPRVDYMYMLALGIAMLRNEAMKQTLYKRKSFLHGYGGLGVALFNSSYDNRIF